MINIDYSVMFSELALNPSWIIGLYEVNNSVCGVNKLITLFHLTSLVAGIKTISFDCNLNLFPIIKFTGFVTSSSNTFIFKNWL